MSFVPLTNPCSPDATSLADLIPSAISRVVYLVDSGLTKFLAALISPITSFIATTSIPVFLKSTPVLAAASLSQKNPLPPAFWTASFFLDISSK